MLTKLTIRPITQEDIQAVQAFLMQQLEDLFNREGQEALPADVWGLGDNYIKPERHLLWAAFDRAGNVAGTIAVCQYNGRIKPLAGRYDLGKTAEIGRCYVSENLRRQGLGAKLLQEATEFCRQQGYQIIYLHTHHFLPGGFNFWQKSGFATVLDEGGSQQTIHMEKTLF